MKLNSLKLVLLFLLSDFLFAQDQYDYQDENQYQNQAGGQAGNYEEFEVDELKVKDNAFEQQSNIGAFDNEGNSYGDNNIFGDGGGGNYNTNEPVNVDTNDPFSDGGGSPDGGGANTTLLPAAEDPLNGTFPANPGLDTGTNTLPTDPTLTGEDNVEGAPAAAASTTRPIPLPNDFSGAPAVPGTMRLMAPGEAPEVYYVELGDTLFDICDQLLDEPAYWPKLWSLNPRIKNPHFIYPGMRLQFYPGSSESPPFLRVVKEEDIVPIEKGLLTEDQLIAAKLNVIDEVFVPAPTEVIGPQELGDIESLFIDVGRIYDQNQMRMTLPGFIYGEELSPKGYIISGVEGEWANGEGRKIMIEIDGGGLSSGSTYTVLRLVEEVDNPESGDFVGYEYQYVGNIKITEEVNSEVLLADVVKSRLGARPGDIVVDFLSTIRTVPNMNVIGQVSTANANIVGFGDDGYHIGGQGHTVFIDRGKNDGVASGQFLRVYQSPGFMAAPEIKDELYEVLLPIGIIRVVDTTDVAAVGLIVDSKREFRIGDVVGKG